MSRKQFIESYGATCKNWNWSWSFINKKKKIIIFGAWDRQTKGNVALILSEKWKANSKGRKSASYPQSREHIRLIEEEGYKLKTFPIIFSDEKIDEDGFGPATIGGFVPKLTSKKLIKVGSKWYASDKEIEFSSPDEIDIPEKYIEGASKEVFINVYERNPAARKKCIEHYGYKCSVCDFNFEKIYGEIGKGYIHVHHIVPLAKLKKAYKLNPIKDLIPICPNCHAMIHRTDPVMKVKELRKHLSLI